MSSAELLHLPVRLEGATRIEEATMELINKHALRKLTEEEVFTFEGIASNDRLDGHFTRMDPETTLKNYAEDLKEGVPLLEFHDIYRHPHGRSYDGELFTKNKEHFVRGRWYIVKDLELNGSNTNNAIRAIESGIIRDMSVGFGGQDAWYKCGICNRDLFDWQCEHIPGLLAEDGTREFAWIMNARLREVSTVYKGSAPGAYIEKARAYIEQGQLEENKILHLEQQFQVRFDRKPRNYFVTKKFTPKGSENVDILEQIRVAISEGKLEKRSVYDLLEKEGEVYRHPEDVKLRNELGEHATVEGVKQLIADAEHGKVYIADLVDQAVQARIRVQGNDFNADSYKAMLARSADIEYLKDEIKAYEKMASEKFTSGRQTQKETFAEPNVNVKPLQDENIFNN